MENAATRMVRGQDLIRYHLRRQVRQSMMDNLAPHTRFLTLPAWVLPSQPCGFRPVASLVLRDWEMAGMRKQRTFAEDLLERRQTPFSF